eukprot:m.134628 g.134628  ORF g.134628 m.134628 type:complete len:252 (-) comp13878_c0_seq1:1579-2334(-)
MALADDLKTSVRIDLVVAHRLTAHYGFDELSWNHISGRVSKSEYLVTPGDQHYDMLTAGDLVTVTTSQTSGELANETGGVIHSAIYQSREDVGAIVHTHIPEIVAVACLEKGLQIYDQSGAIFHNDVAYYDWQGVSLDREEGPMLSAAVAGGQNTLMMRNHGACTFGATVGEAWIRMFYLARACRLQLDLLKTGQSIRLPPQQWVRKTAEDAQNEYKPGKVDWEPMKEWVLAGMKPRRVIQRRRKALASSL